MLAAPFFSFFVVVGGVMMDPAFAILSGNNNNKSLHCKNVIVAALKNFWMDES